MCIVTCAYSLLCDVLHKHVAVPGCGDQKLEFPTAGNVSASPEHAASQKLCLLLWMGKPHVFPVLSCHVMTDSLTSLSLGHMTYFDCIFLANLARYRVSFPEGDLGQNPWILRVSRSIWKEEENQRWARKRQAEKDERIWGREAFTFGMKLPSSWPKAEQFTLSGNMRDGPAPAPRSKHFKGACRVPYLCFYKLLSDLWVSGYIPVACSRVSFKCGGVSWRYLSPAEEGLLLEVVYPQQCICRSTGPVCCDTLSCANSSLKHLCIEGVHCNPASSAASCWGSRT